MSNILIIRTSAIGDVAMTIPVVYSVAEDNPQDAFTMLTHTSVMPLFINHPPNLQVIGINTKTTEKSFFSLLRFGWALRANKFDMVIDLHNVLRSWILDFIIRLTGAKIYIMKKLRSANKQISARPPKKIFQIRPVINRYSDVFRTAGFKFEVTFVSLFAKNPVDETAVKAMAGDKTGFWIGIAPFARHKGKIYPIDKMEKIVARYAKRSDCKLFLFGGGGDEKNILDRWESIYKHTVNVSGHFTMDMELVLMSRLDVMVSMDSANMHLALLTGAKVVSIWGATHPYAGFYGYRRDENKIVQTNLPCRPCSVYGNKPCYRRDYACLTQIKPENIIEKIEAFLQ